MYAASRLHGLRHTAAKLLAATSLVTLVACGGGGDEGDVVGPVSGDTAVSCLNMAQLTTAGNTQRLQWTVRAGAETYTDVTDSVVLGPATYNGQAVINTREVFTFIPAAGPADALIQVSHDSANGSTALNHGWTSESSPGVATDALRITPAEAFRFDLKAGESTTQTLQEVWSSDLGTTTTRTTRWTFVGFEDVTVPAGTFRNACRFSLEDTSTTSTEVLVLTENLWIANGNTVVLKAVSTITDQGQTLTSTRELVSATLNGQPLVPR